MIRQICQKLEFNLLLLEAPDGPFAISAMLRNWQREKNKGMPLRSQIKNGGLLTGQTKTPSSVPERR
jgi:hypothetical protein